MKKTKRIAAIDWMRGFVMLIMVLDHASMAYNVGHNSSDSASLHIKGAALPEFAFFTRCISHLCAPVFVFLAGTALAISVERKLAKGFASNKIDKDILFRGLFIALLDPTVISLFSGRLTIQVLYAIGVSMMCMVFLRRFSSTSLLILAFAWIGLGELLTAQVWPPQNNVESIISALFISTYSAPDLVIKYPLLPWLAIMLLGWVFGRYLLAFSEGKTRIGPFSLLFTLGTTALIAFISIRYYNEYGNMFLYREGDSWQQWLHVSKYPISATFTLLTLGVMSIILAVMMLVERLIGVRPNGVLLVFGQTAMVFYLIHRLIFEGSASYGELRHAGDIYTAYFVSIVMLLVLYPFCLWYRGFKVKHAQSIFLRYL